MDVVVIVFNLVLWVVLLLGALRIIKRYSAASVSASPLPLLPITALWLAGALAFGVLAGQESRFGGVIYPLEIVFVALLISSAEIPGLRALGQAALAILALAFVWNASGELRQHSTQPLAMKKLMAAIRAQSAPVVYVVSAPLDWTSTPDSVATVIGSSARVVILNQFEGCLTGPGGATTFGAPAPHLSIQVQYPECAHLTMGSVPPRILARGVDGSLPRGQFATYRFPQGKVLANAKAVGAEPTVTLGTRLELNLDPGPADGYALLYYDWSRGSYVTAGPRMASASTRTGPARNEATRESSAGVTPVL
jgi:hypothetical protein